MIRFPFPSRLVTLTLLPLVIGLAGCSGSTTSTVAEVDPGIDTSPPPVDTTPPDPVPPPPEQTPPAPGDPAVSLAASDEVVASGETVELSWSGENIDDCTASGGWSGARGVSGRATVGPIDQSTTFSLTCNGPGGNAMAMLSVSVLGVVSLAWEAPTENVDGSPLTDLTGYRIYYGSRSRSYTDELPVDGAATTAQDVVLASGSYYFAMTAMDAEGNESGYSNEVLKVVN